MGCSARQEQPPHGRRTIIIMRRAASGAVRWGGEGSGRRGRTRWRSAGRGAASCPGAWARGPPPPPPPGRPPAP
eukprot:scaffold741_cov303-Prasinococcus_capsulatus_cf.AAC.3